MLLQTTLANKVDKLREIEKLLERNSLWRLNQKEIENMNKPIISNEADTVIKILPTNESLGSEDS